MSEIQIIPARSGVALHLTKGQMIQVINTHGKQVIDFFAFSTHDPGEYMSLSHTRGSCLRLIPALGEQFVSNKREPMLTFLEDTSPGVHDGLIAACDIYRYQQLGVVEYHENCSDNMRNALKQLLGADYTPTHVPQPLNLFMNIPLEQDGKVAWGEPKSEPGDYVKFRAEMDLVIVMSACPQDLIRVNAMKPTQAHFTIC